MLTFVLYSDSSKVMQPGKETFNMPPSFIPPQDPAILRFGSLTIAAIWRDHFDVRLLQNFIQWITVIGHVANQLFWEIIDKYFGEIFSDKGDFMRLSRRCVNGERKTSVICHCHELATLTPLGISHSCTPFLATTKVLSMKHSLKSNWPRSFRSVANASKMPCNVTSLTHCWKGRCLVW